MNCVGRYWYWNSIGTQILHRYTKHTTRYTRRRNTNTTQIYQTHKIREEKEHKYCIDIPNTQQDMRGEGTQILHRYNKHTTRNLRRRNTNTAQIKQTHNKKLEEKEHKYCIDITNTQQDTRGEGTQILHRYTKHTRYARRRNTNTA